jgi:hypothetical protein
MLKRYRNFALMISLTAALVGCATTRALQRLSLDMTKAEVTRSIGSPLAVRGAIKNKFDETIEVWEYRLDVPFFQAQSLDENQTYWLYFVEDRLVRWGQAGDWAKEADRIYEVRFGAANILATP